MEYRKSPHNVDPVVVMSSIFRRPQTWAVLLLILFAPILAGSILASTQNQEMLNNTTATLRETSERQRDFAVSTLDSIALIMNENTSNIHYIDVGRTEAKDDEVDAALACQVLRQNTEPYPNINSAYLICNLNHTIYNSLDKIGYADDEFYDLSWRLHTTRPAAVCNCWMISVPCARPTGRRIPIFRWSAVCRTFPRCKTSGWCTI